MRMMVVAAIAAIIIPTGLTDAPKPVSDRAVFEACMARAEALDYPPGVGPEIMEPHCHCVAQTNNPAARRNLVETASLDDNERARETSADASQALAACFETSHD
ncbi:MAG: hypothetical protein AAFQ21_01755 [Pseudomonadota bacterium]